MGKIDLNKEASYLLGVFSECQGINKNIYSKMSKEELLNKTIIKFFK